MSIKVHKLAKELGVDSKAIIEKCIAEGVTEVDSHMSVVKVGLALSIREWFSQGAPRTAVEKTAHVAVEKVPPKRGRKKKDADDDADRSSAAPVAAQAAAANGAAAPVATEPASVSSMETPVVPARRPRGRPRKVASTAPLSVASAGPPVAEVPGVVAAATSAEVVAKPVVATPGHSPVEAGAKPIADVPAKPVLEIPVKPVKPVAPVVPRGVPNVVAKPVVTPVGPRHVPAPAQLKGPNVVRIAAPEVIEPPRARVRPSPYSSEPSAVDRMPSFPPGGSGSHRNRAKPGEPLLDDEEAKARRNKGRTARHQGGRMGGADVDLIREWREADLQDRAERLASATGGMLRVRRRQLNKAQQKNLAAHSPTQKPSSIEIIPPVTLRHLSELMGVKAGDMLKKLLTQGAMVTVNQSLDLDVAQMLAMEYGIELIIKKKESQYVVLERNYRQIADTAERTARPPVVTILGHVDHGKTSLLDKIRSANVAAGEAGGITQHIGAYTVSLTGSDGKPKRVTFLDTPGHQAFTAMRARGANLTDVVVLVVAADDGVMPQTVESIDHAKAANVPIVVALNKIDKPEANANKVLGQLAEHGLNPVEWGGDVEVVRTSAATGQGVKELIEYLDYTATLRELKASPQLPARGTVIEAFMDPLRGVVARVMVQNGTLRIGDAMVCGPASGRVRQLLDDQGRPVTEAGPATPVEVFGLDNVPIGADPLYVVDDLAKSKSIAEERAHADRESDIAQRTKVTLENLFDTIKRGEIKELNMILKADVQGSVDVLRQTMTRELSKEVQVRLLHAAVGGISESDVLLAEASNAIVVGFCVEPDESARKLAERRGVDIRLYRVIYEITDDIHKALTGMLAPEKQDQVIGHAEVRQVIRVSRVGSIAGCMVTDGVLQRTAKYRLIRDGATVAENMVLDSLRRFKEDAREVRAGLECGLKLAGRDDIKVGDTIAAYKTVDVARTL